MASLLATSVAAFLLATNPGAPQPKLKKRAAEGMVIGGAITTALSTWGIGLVSAVYLDSPDPARRRAGQMMPIPVAGPIIAAAEGDEEMRPLAPLGVYQGAGLALLTVGSISLARHRRDEETRRQTSQGTGVILITQGVMWLAISWGMTYGFSKSRADAGDVFSQRLQLPIVGGLLAAPHAPTYTRGYLGLTSTAFQLLSAGAIVSGAVMVASHKRRRNMSLLPVPSPEGGHVVFAMRF